MSPLQASLREKFAQHKALEDPAVIDVLCYKGEQELQETLNVWKTKAHVQKYVVDMGKSSGSVFADEFFKGYQVEEWTWPPQHTTRQ